MRFGWVLVLLALLGGAVAAAAATPVTAVLTGGSGVLIKCYGWFSGGGCNTYHHIRVPQRIAIGDTIPITFGSNPKYYGFPVQRIKLVGDRCRIYGGQQSGGEDRLIVAACHPAPPP